jgi:hypothetical protein
MRRGQLRQVPDESPVEVRHPRSRQEEQSDGSGGRGRRNHRSAGLTNGMCTRSANWSCCATAARRAGPPAVVCHPAVSGQLGDPATPASSGPALARRGRAGERGLGDPFATAAVVCAVAAFAAVVSYSHIYGLGRAQPDGTAARLLPLSVDGGLSCLVVPLHEARNGRDAPRLARFMLWLGIAATIGANIAFGADTGARRADLGLARRHSSAQSRRHAAVRRSRATSGSPVPGRATDAGRWSRRSARRGVGHGRQRPSQRGWPSGRPSAAR